MTSTGVDYAIDRIARPRSRRRHWLVRNWTMAAGAAVLLCFVVAALLAPLLNLDNPDAVQATKAFLPVFSPGHLLGTDEFGRDVLSRLIWGARISLPFAVFATIASLIGGTIIGTVAGLLGGWTESTLMRLVDAVVGVPMILLAIIIVSILGPSAMNAAIALAIASIPFFARMTRAIVVRLRTREFFVAGIGMGLRRRQVVRLHVLPHLSRPLVVYGTLDLGYKLIAMASLSFIGLGTQPPSPDWGNMLAEGRDVLTQAPQVVVVPGIAVALCVLSLNVVGDWLQDRIGPKS